MRRAVTAAVLVTAGLAAPARADAPHVLVVRDGPFAGGAYAQCVVSPGVADESTVRYLLAAHAVASDPATEVGVGCWVEHRTTHEVYGYVGATTTGMAAAATGMVRAPAGVPTAFCVTVSTRFRAATRCQ
ncbi:MAG TPA: hypothetical protein VFQ85_05910 [Mycobacteriales bacterium]|jgi:hypothetical protein|nr:hypothetical protein [Mycobacteriales bacterium]